MLVFSIIFYLGSAIAIILLYIFFTEVRTLHITYNIRNLNVIINFQLASCTLNKFFISSTLIFSVIISIVAILPWVQKGQL